MLDNGMRIYLLIKYNIFVFQLKKRFYNKLLLSQFINTPSPVSTCKTFDPYLQRGFLKNKFPTRKAASGSTTFSQLMTKYPIIYFNPPQRAVYDGALGPR